MPAELTRSCLSSLLLVSVYCRLSASLVAESLDDSLRLQRGELVAKPELVAVDVCVVFAEQRRTDDVDRGVGQLDRAADGGEFASLGVINPDHHVVGRQRGVFDDLLSGKDWAARDVVLGEGRERLPLAKAHRPFLDELKHLVQLVQSRLWHAPL